MSDQLSERSSFVWPEFWNFPPYFTLQPVPETQQKQKELWRSLIIAYCRHCRVFYVGMEDDFPPFANASINSKSALFLSIELIHSLSLFFCLWLCVCLCATERREEGVGAPLVPVLWFAVCMHVHDCKCVGEER